MVVPIVSILKALLSALREVFSCNSVYAAYALMRAVSIKLYPEEFGE